MRTNTDLRAFDVIEITNEMPFNRVGGVGTMIEHLMSGFERIGVRALWYLLDHSYLPAEVESLLAHYPSMAVGTHDELAQFRAPVAHLHAYSVNERLLEALEDQVTLYTVHSLLAEEERSNDVDLSGAVEWQKVLIANCDHVALVSNAELVHYRRLGYQGLNPCTTVVHNGISAPRTSHIRRSRRTLGFCGRLVPRKHPEYVQMILNEPGFDHCRTLIAGKAFSRYARDMVNHLGLQDRVKYLGWCGNERLEAFYDALDVLALPSVYEPFGFAALEAVARRIPVVCTRTDGLREILREDAIYCEDSTYSAFGNAMKRWAEADGDVLTTHTGRAHARFLECFTDVEMARRYERLFARIS